MLLLINGTIDMNKRLALPTIFSIISLLSTLFDYSYSKALSIVPSASEMIFKSDVIVEGVVKIDNGKAMLNAKSILKGNVGKELQFNLIFGENDMHSMIANYPDSLEGKLSIILGKYEKRTNSIRLTWNSFSVWPNGYASQSVSQQQYDDYRSYIVALLEYGHIYERKQEDLFEVLLNDLNDTNRMYAVLGFAESFLSPTVKNKSLEKEFLYILMAELYSRRIYNKRVVVFINDTSPRLPSTLALRFLLHAAKDKDNELANVSFSSARSILVGHRIVSASEVSSITKLEDIVAEKSSYLAVQDSKKALSLFESSSQVLRTRANRVLVTILYDSTWGEVEYYKTELEKTPKNSVEAKEYWLKIIKQKE